MIRMRRNRGALDAFFAVPPREEPSMFVSERPVRTEAERAARRARRKARAVKAARPAVAAHNGRLAAIRAAKAKTKKRRAAA